ncbi:omptin family outer membrane protease [Enterobacter bugandensis]
MKRSRRQAKVFTEASYTYHPNIRGKIERWDSEGYNTLSDGVGMQNRNWTITAGLQYL